MARLASLVGVPIAGALRFQGSGQITDLGMLADALEEAFRARGGTIERSSARLSIDGGRACIEGHNADIIVVAARSEEHTSEIQSLMCISYAVFCLKKKKAIQQN